MPLFLIEIYFILAEYESIINYWISIKRCKYYK